jgi:hypothetical protein
MGTVCGRVVWRKVNRRGWGTNLRETKTTKMEEPTLSHIYGFCDGECLEKHIQMSYHTGSSSDHDEGMASKSMNRTNLGKSKSRRSKPKLLTTKMNSAMLKTSEKEIKSNFETVEKLVMVPRKANCGGETNLGKSKPRQSKLKRPMVNMKSARLD